MEQIKSYPYPQVEDFIEKQTALLLIEHDEEANLIKRLLNEVTAKDLAIAGYALYNLKLKKQKVGLGGRWILVFNYKETTIPQHLRLGSGDQVAIFQWSKIQPSGTFGAHTPQSMGLIDRISANTIGIVIDKRFKDAQSDLNSELEQGNVREDFNQTREYAIAIVDNQVTYRRHQKILQQLSKAKDINPLVSYLFPKQSIKCTQSNMIEPHLNKNFQSLNQLQQEAVVKCMNQNRLGMIHGPPGTGKTKTLCEYIFQATSVQNLKVLATAPSNIAVDNIIEGLMNVNPKLRIVRLGHPTRVIPAVRDKCLDVLVRKTSSWNLYIYIVQSYIFNRMKTLKLEIQKTERKIEKASYKEQKTLKSDLYAMYKERKSLQEMATQEVLDESVVVLCTNSGAGDWLIKNRQFDVIAIDECAQALEVSCWIPMLKGRKVILAGDHKQLPPTIKSLEAEVNGLGRTLFERILNEVDKDKQHSILLRTQYRMNEIIMEWSSSNVYDGMLVADESVKNHSIKDFQLEQEDDSNLVMLLIDTSGCEMNEAEQEILVPSIRDLSRSKFNQGEAELIKILVKELIQLQVKTSDIGVFQLQLQLTFKIITPYSAQVQCIRSNLSDLIANIEVSTVDGFQGREKECIIISMVRSNNSGEVGFLNEYRRMNVAVTRAKRFVCLVGNQDTVSNDPFLKNMIAYFSQHGEVRSAAMYNIQVAGSSTKKQTKPIITENKEKKTKTKKKKQEKQNLQTDQKKIQEIKEIKEDDKQQKEDYFKRIIDEFMSDSKTEEFNVPNLNSYERMLVHDIAGKLGLEHLSIGTSAIKDIKIRKIKNYESSIIEISENEEEIQEPLVNEQMEQKNMKKNKFLQQSNVFQNLYSSGEESSENGQIEQIVQVEEKKKQNKQINKNKKKQKQPQPQKQQLEEESDNPIEDQKQKNQQSDPLNGLSKQIIFKYSQLEISASNCQFIEQTSIHRIQCQKPLNLLSLKCKFCKKDFCSKHLMAEEHGCGDEAKIQARQKYVDSLPRPKEEQNEQLRDQLNAKLREAQHKRNKKQSKK